jgi:hypothetical protein
MPEDVKAPRARLAWCELEFDQLRDGIATIRQLSKDIESVNARNLADANKLAVIRLYNRQVGRECARLIP